MKSTFSWARRVLQSRNDKTLADRVTELVSSLGVVGEQVLAACPRFAVFVARARTGVSHPAQSSLSNVERYWLGDVLNWVMRAKILVETGLPLTEVERRVSLSAPFRHALEQIRSI
jgi:Apea-like HEPN